MISKIRTKATPALIVTQKKKRKKNIFPAKNRLAAMTIWCKQFYYLLSLRLLSANIKLKYWLMPEVVVSDLYYKC